MASLIRSSERVRARRAAAEEPSALLRALVGDPLRAIARLLSREDRFRMRLACKTMRDHAEPAASRRISRVAFLRARSLAAFACDELRDFMRADKGEMLALAATVGCVAVLAELMDNRGCTARLDARAAAACCAAAAAHGQLEALVWLPGRGCFWDASVCARAAEGGHLEVLRYAREHGCPWKEDGICYDAARVCRGAAVRARARLPNGLERVLHA
jgi:hypothetical protein